MREEKMLSAEDLLYPQMREEWEIGGVSRQTVIAAEGGLICFTEFGDYSSLSITKADDGGEKVDTIYIDSVKAIELLIESAQRVITEMKKVKER